MGGEKDCFRFSPGIRSSGSDSKYVYHFLSPEDLPPDFASKEKKKKKKVLQTEMSKLPRKNLIS